MPKPCGGLPADGLQLAADDAELVADLAAKEDEGNDGDDGDQREDECIFCEALAILVVTKSG